MGKFRAPAKAPAPGKTWLQHQLRIPDTKNKNDTNDFEEQND